MPKDRNRHLAEETQLTRVLIAKCQITFQDSPVHLPNGQMFKSLYCVDETWNKT